MLSVTCRTCYPAFSLLLIIICHVRNSSFSRRRVDTAQGVQIICGCKKHKRLDGSSSSGTDLELYDFFFQPQARRRSFRERERDPGLDSNYWEWWFISGQQANVQNIQKHPQLWEAARNWSTATWGQEEKKKVEGTKRNEDIWGFWDEFDGGAGYISKWMFGSLAGTGLRFPAEDENGQARMKGWNRRQQGGGESCSGILAWGHVKRLRKKSQIKRKKMYLYVYLYIYCCAVTTPHSSLEKNTPDPENVWGLDVSINDLTLSIHKHIF